jgi:hypothetical protein
MTLFIHNVFAVLVIVIFSRTVKRSCKGTQLDCNFQTTKKNFPINLSIGGHGSRAQHTASLLFHYFTDLRKENIKE